MYCEQCGNELGAAAGFCSACGRAVAAVGRPIASGGRVARNARLLGILWLCYSGLHALGTVWLVIFSRVFLPIILPRITAEAGDLPFDRIISTIVFFAAAYSAFITILGFVAGWGLLQRQTSARIVSLVAGILALLNIPFGTALGIYTLWVFVPAGSDREYIQLCAGS